MYLITWTDRRTGEQKKLTVSTVRACRDVVSTLTRDSYNAEHVTATRIAPRRLREIVISFER